MIFSRDKYKTLKGTLEGAWGKDLKVNRILKGTQLRVAKLEPDGDPNFYNITFTNNSTIGLLRDKDIEEYFKVIKDKSRMEWIQQ